MTPSPHQDDQDPRPATPAGADAAPLTLGTSGHIDHGKTALVGLLTGKNTDRLREERERGISIELGYAELELPSGNRLSVVDVPGHERFVRTMVAGATGIDLFLLVIAADDGVMPQTVEHLGIIDLLGVQTGVVALSKADLVDDELLALAEEDVRDFLGDTPYANVEVVTVSARDGRGQEELLAALDRAAVKVRARRHDGPARLPVDRVFPLKGIGTVVTGTLWQGHVSLGDALVVEPGALRTAVRSVQVHDHETDLVHAGSRVGLNLRGLRREDIHRGSWVVAPELSGRVSRRFDAWVRVLPGAKPLRNGSWVRLHHGTSQFLARVAPLADREIAPGTAAVAVVRLDAEEALQPRDRFILRALSPVSTIGGGEVLAVTSRRWHAREHHASFLEALLARDLERAARHLAQDAGRAGLTMEQMIDLGFSNAEVLRALAAAVGAGNLEALAPAPPRQPTAPATGGRRWFAPDVLANLRVTLLEGARDHTAKQPERPFSAAAELAALVPELPVGDIEAVLRGLRADGDLVAGEGGFAPADVGVLDEQQAELARRLTSRLELEPMAPPTLAVLAEESGRPAREIAKVLDSLARRGDVVRVEKDLWFAAAAVTAAREALATMLADDGEVGLAAFRDRMACGRRNAQALLELFDREALTLRRGDVRVARRRR